MQKIAITQVFEAYYFNKNLFFILHAELAEEILHNALHNPHEIRHCILHPSQKGIEHRGY